MSEKCIVRIYHAVDIKSSRRPGLFLTESECVDLRRWKSTQEIKLYRKKKKKFKWKKNSFVIDPGQNIRAVWDSRNVTALPLYLSLSFDFQWSPQRKENILYELILWLSSGLLILRVLSFPLFPPFLHLLTHSTGHPIPDHWALKLWKLPSTKGHRESSQPPKTPLFY